MYNLFEYMYVCVMCVTCVCFCGFLPCNAHYIKHDDDHFWFSFVLNIYFCFFFTHLTFNIYLLVSTCVGQCADRDDDSQSHCACLCQRSATPN